MRLLYAHAGDIGHDATMRVTNHKAIAARQMVAAPCPARRNNPILGKSLSSSPGIKDVAHVDIDWTALASGWSFVALDRVAWAWSSARRHRRRAQELYFIYPNRDRARNQRGAD